MTTKIIVYLQPFSDSNINDQIETELAIFGEPGTIEYNKSVKPIEMSCIMQYTSEATKAGNNIEELLGKYIVGINYKEID